MQSEVKTKARKTVLLTFDYELFLGALSGTVDNCLLKPTSAVLEILNNNQAKAIFFVDTTYLKKLQEINTKHFTAMQDFARIKEQLAAITKAGHYLFHHLHPHWQDAKYLENKSQWDLSNVTRLALSDIDCEEIEELFSYSNEILQEINALSGTEAPIDGFRAGGLFIEPFEHIRKIFQLHGLKYEFSVIQESTIPHKPYRFDLNIKREAYNGEFIEYPISTIEIKGLRKIMNGLFFRLRKRCQRNHIFGDGIAVQEHIRRSGRKKSFTEYFRFTLPLSLDILNPVLLPAFKQFVRKHNYIHLLSHPKLLSPEGLQNFDKLLKFCNENFDLNYDFKEINQEW